jgi:hypothetical protein
MKALTKSIEEYDAFEKIRQWQAGDSIEGRRIDVVEEEQERACGERKGDPLHLMFCPQIHHSQLPSSSSWRKARREFC